MHTDIRIVTVGASAGGVEALTRLVADLPADLDAAVLVVLHVAPDLPSYLPRILQRSGPLPCVHGADGDPLRAGQIIVAPPDRHMAVEDGCIRIWNGSRENRQRPSIDVLFRSAAVAHGPNTIGVILSGALDDGVAGMDAITRAGGHALVQDPDEARHPYLPRNVLHAVPRAEALPMELLVKRIKQLIDDPRVADARPDALEAAQLEQEMVRRMATQEEMARLGPLSGFTCPECNGVLTTVETTGQVRYRCHTGHGYTAQSLFLEQSEQVERLLRQTLRQMREAAETARTLIDHARSVQDREQTVHFQERLHEAERGIHGLYKLMASIPSGEVRPQL